MDESVHKWILTKSMKKKRFVCFRKVGADKKWVICLFACLFLLLFFAVVEHNCIIVSGNCSIKFDSTQFILPVGAFLHMPQLLPGIM